MKKIYKISTALALLVLTSGLVKAVPGARSSHPVDPAITTNGIVRVLFVVDLDTINGGIVAVEDSMYHYDTDNVNKNMRFDWNGMAGIVRTNNGDSKHVGNDTIDFYDGTFLGNGDPAPDGKGTYSQGLETKLWETGDTICAWFTINVPAKLQTIHLQKSDELDVVTKCLENAGTRNKSFAEINMIQSVGDLTTGVPVGPKVIEVTRVDEVKPYFVTPTATKNIAIKNLKVFPTQVSDILNISADTEISHIEIFSITGTQVIYGTSKSVNVSNLVAGTYIVSVTDVLGAKSFTRIIKE